MEHFKLVPITENLKRLIYPYLYKNDIHENIAEIWESERFYRIKTVNKFHSVSEILIPREAT